MIKKSWSFGQWREINWFSFFLLMFVKCKKGNRSWAAFKALKNLKVWLIFPQSVGWIGQKRTPDSLGCAARSAKASLAIPDDRIWQIRLVICVKQERKILIALCFIWQLGALKVPLLWIKNRCVHSWWHCCPCIVLPPAWTLQCCVVKPTQMSHLNTFD